MNKVVEEVIASYGGIPGVMTRFKYKDPMAVYNWRSRGIPQRLIADIHLDTEIPITRLKKGLRESVA